MIIYAHADGEDPVYDYGNGLSEYVHAGDYVHHMKISVENVRHEDGHDVHHHDHGDDHEQGEDVNGHVRGAR